MIPKIFLTPIPKPDLQLLRNLLFLLFGKPVVKIESPLPFLPAGAVFVRGPIGAGQANATIGLFDESRAR